MPPPPQIQGIIPPTDLLVLPAALGREGPRLGANPVHLKFCLIELALEGRYIPYEKLFGLIFF